MLYRTSTLFLLSLYFISFQSVDCQSWLRQQTQQSSCSNLPTGCNNCEGRAVVMYCHRENPCTTPNTICCESSCCVTSCVVYNNLARRGWGGGSGWGNNQDRWENNDRGGFLGNLFGKKK